MLKTIEAKGKTVDEAIFAGLSELGLQLDEVTIDIISEGKGIFGIGKNAVVRLTQKENDARRAEEFISKLIEKMGVSAEISVTEVDGALRAEISGDTTGVLIGRHGDTLDAIQYITSLVVNRTTEEYKRITVDTEGYRKKREETLARLANRLAAKVVRTGRRVALEPMNPYERRILHSTLQPNPMVETISEGEEPNRRVIIVRTRKNEDGTDMPERSYDKRSGRSYGGRPRNDRNDKQRQRDNRGYDKRGGKGGRRHEGGYSSGHSSDNADYSKKTYDVRDYLNKD